MTGREIRDKLGGTLKRSHQKTGTPRARSLVPLFASLLTLLALATTSLTLATIATASLPDGRIYEQVSPAYKNGNLVDFAQEFAFGLAEAGGDAIVYPMSGAVGSAYSGTASQYVSRRTPGNGWSTTQATPRQVGRTFSLFREAPITLVPSADFSKFLFAGDEAYVQGDEKNSLNIFVLESSAHEPQWISQPQLPNPTPGLGTESLEENYVVAGASADLRTVYFSYAGALLPEDATREPYVRGGHGDGNIGSEDAPWGFYEWADGGLREAGALPDGDLSPFGAVPAALGLLPGSGRKHPFQAGSFDDWVSSDGKRALFMSPDPLASSVSNPSECAEAPPCTSEPPELYLREALPDGSHRVTLVSHAMLPGEEGDTAPDGPALTSNPTGQGTTYAFGTPGESHVFFASTDRLTEAAPSNGEVKEYEYKTDTGGLTYLPGVQGEIAATGSDGSELMFVNSANGELELWRSGPGGMTVTPVAETGGLRTSQFSKDGSIFVFSTRASIPGFNNGGINSEGVSPLELYRYDVASNTLTCVSCTPVGVTPTGDAYTSYNNEELFGEEVRHFNGGKSDPQTTIETRAVSADGDRVFFDTPNALVPQDTNGVRDVYEWDNGTVYLISPGGSGDPSYYLDSSESGDDAFFTTGSGLLPGDTDEAYDVYDARVPRPGDIPPPSVVPCKGSVCQGPPSVPQLLGQPASETFNGVGNIATPLVAKVAPRHVRKPAKKKKKHKSVKGHKAKGHAKKSGSHRNGGSK